MIATRSLPGRRFIGSATTGRVQAPRRAPQPRRLIPAVLAGAAAGGLLAIAMVHPVTALPLRSAAPAAAPAAATAAGAVAQLQALTGAAVGAFVSDPAPVAVPAPPAVAPPAPVAAPPAPAPAPALPQALPAQPVSRVAAPVSRPASHVNVSAPPPAAPTLVPPPAGAVGQIINLVNADRAAHGLAALSFNSALSQAAQVHAQQDAAANTMTHNGVFADVAAAGITYRTLGECLGEETPNLDAGFINTLWMQSTEHRTIILTPGYTSAGVGWAKSSTGTWYVSLIVMS